MPKAEADAPTQAKPRKDKSEERSGSRRRGRRREPEEAVVGLGDHVPSFLLRPVTRPRSDDK